MTFEREPDDEAPDGPEHDSRLPDAAAVPCAPGPFDLQPATDPDDWED